MVERNTFLRNAKYELIVYLMEQGIKDINTLVAIKPDEAADKLKGAPLEILEMLTRYVKATQKRITKKGYFFPGVATHEHASKVSTVNGLRKYLVGTGKTLEGIGLARGRKSKISTAEDALAFLKSVKK